jgi:EamA domain-containing membrane protein RarD
MGGYRVILQHSWVAIPVVAVCAVLIAFAGLALHIGIVQRVTTLAIAVAMGYHVYTILTRLPAEHA